VARCEPTHKVLPPKEERHRKKKGVVFFGLGGLKVRGRGRRDFRRRTGRGTEEGDWGHRLQQAKGRSNNLAWSRHKRKYTLKEIKGGGGGLGPGARMMPSRKESDAPRGFH